MAVQKEILTRTVTQTGHGLDKPFVSGTGVLALGIPGKIYSTYPGNQGPGAHTTVLKEDAEVGTFLKGHGIIVNAPEYALKGGLTPTLKVEKGVVVTCVTMGEVIVKESAVEDILAGMTGRVIPWPTEQFDEDDASDASDASEDSSVDPLVVVQVDGLK